MAPIGSSFVGDSDNDGKGEFIHGADTGEILLWESDVVGADNFANTFIWSPVADNMNIMIGNLYPLNDHGDSDCDDNDDTRYPGALDICEDGIDQDCDGSDAVCNCADNDLDDYYAFDTSSCPTGDDCDDDDNSINPGADEVCGDIIDNNCNQEIDEGCGPVCGDLFCAGNSFGEDCRSCPTDCPAGPRGVCCGDGECDTRKGETAGFCPVDCS